MGQHHQEAITLEFKIRKIFNCGRGGFGGLANADFIDIHPYLVMVSSLMYIYTNKADKEKEEIERFISDYTHWSNYTIDEIIAEDKNIFIEMSKRFMNLI